MYSSNLARSWPPSASLHSPNQSLQLHLYTHSIMAFNCISKLAISRPPCASPNSLDHSLPLYLQTQSNTPSNFAISWPSSAYVQTRLITASNWNFKLAWLGPPSSYDHGLKVNISTLPRSRPASASPKSLYDGVLMHFQSQSIMACNYISYNTWVWPSSAPPNLLNHYLGVYLRVHSITVWWHGWATTRRAHDQHSASPCIASEGKSWERVVLARGVYKEGEKICQNSQLW
jgi:hypothetical protein